MHSDSDQTLDAAPMLDDPEAGSSWFITIASIVVLVVLLVALAVMYFRFENAEIERKVVDRPAEELLRLRTAQTILLSENQTYTDPENGETLRRIPIAEAMREIAAACGPAAEGGRCPAGFRALLIAPAPRGPPRPETRTLDPDPRRQFVKSVTRRAYEYPSPDRWSAGLRSPLLRAAIPPAPPTPDLPR